MAMGQKPNRSPGEHPNPTTKIGSTMGGEFTYQPKWDPKTVLTTTAMHMEFQLTFPKLKCSDGQNLGPMGSMSVWTSRLCRRIRCFSVPLPRPFARFRWTSELQELHGSDGRRLGFAAVPLVFCSRVPPLKWLWLKTPVQKWNPGKWQHGPKPA